jgi:hypothetical protein
MMALCGSWLYIDVSEIVSPSSKGSDFPLAAAILVRQVPGSEGIALSNHSQWEVEPKKWVLTEPAIISAGALSPVWAQCFDHTGRLRQSSAKQPVPVPVPGGG